MTFIADTQDDGSLNRDQQKFLIKREREKMLPSMIDGASQVRAIAAQTNAAHRFWDSKVFVLSQQNFSDTPSTDATIKMWKAQQLAAMPTPILSLAFDDAKANGDYATMALVIGALASRKIAAGELNPSEFSIDDVELPGRAEALQAIRSIETDRKNAETLFSESAGMRHDPVNSLIIGRERAALGAA